MKKIFSILSVAVLSLFAFTACDPETDESAGGTAVEAMAGNWDVIAEVIDMEDPENPVNYGDYYGVGEFTLFTYNNAANDKDKLFIYEESFWGLQTLANCNLATNEISADASLNLLAEEEEHCNISGKIIPNGCKNEHGMPNDSICIDIIYDSEPEVMYRYTGHRHTGFAE